MCSGMLPSLACAGIPVCSNCSALGRVTSSGASGAPGSTSGDVVEGPGGGGSAEPPPVPRNWAITVGSASTGLTRKPDLGCQIVDILLRRRLGEGHRQHVSVELDPDGLELLRHGIGHGCPRLRARCHGRQIDGRELGQMGHRPHYHPGKCQIPPDQQGGQRLAGLPGLRDQGGEVGFGLVSALDQCLGQSGRPLRTRCCGEGTHATTRSTSSRVVSPSMALRRPLRRNVTIPWVTASLWISSTDPPSIIIRSISSLIGISSANAFRPR